MELLKYKAFLIRSIDEKIKDSLIGFSWYLISPLFSTLIYVVIITIFFQIKFSSETGQFDFAIYVLSGQTVYILLTQSLVLSSETLKTNIDFIKNMNFSLLIFPFSIMLEILFQVIVIFLILCTLLLISGEFSPFILFYPFFFLPIFVLVYSICCFMMVIGFFFRDLNKILSLLFSILMFFTPVVIKEDFAPAILWKIIEANPISHLIIYARSFFFYNIELKSFVFFSIVSLIVFIFSILVLKIIKPKILDLM